MSYCFLSVFIKCLVIVFVLVFLTQKYPMKIKLFPNRPLECPPHRFIKVGSQELTLQHARPRSIHLPCMASFPMSPFEPRTQRQQFMCPSHKYPSYNLTQAVWLHDLFCVTVLVSGHGSSLAYSLSWQLCKGVWNGELY